MKHTRNFSFDVQLMEGMTNYGMLNISGVGYHFPLEDKHEDKYSYDIDTVTLDGMEVPKGIIECLMKEQMSHISTVIHDATIGHMEYVFGLGGQEEHTDLDQHLDFPNEATLNEALSRVQMGDFSGQNLFNAMSAISMNAAKQYLPKAS